MVHHPGLECHSRLKLWPLPTDSPNEPSNSLTVLVMLGWWSRYMLSYFKFFLIFCYGNGHSMSLLIFIKIACSNLFQEYELQCLPEAHRKLSVSIARTGKWWLHASKSWNWPKTSSASRGCWGSPAVAGFKRRQLTGSDTQGKADRIWLRPECPEWEMWWDREGHKTYRQMQKANKWHMQQGWNAIGFTFVARKTTWLCTSRLKTCDILLCICSISVTFSTSWIVMVCNSSTTATTTIIMISSSWYHHHDIIIMISSSWYHHHISSSYIIIYHHISSSYIIIYHHISSYIIIYHHISSYIIIYHHISSYIIIYHHISSYHQYIMMTSWWHHSCDHHEHRSSLIGHRTSSSPSSPPSPSSSSSTSSFSSSMLDWSFFSLAGSASVLPWPSPSCLWGGHHRKAFSVLAITTWRLKFSKEMCGTTSSNSVSRCCAMPAMFFWWYHPWIIRMMNC